MKSLVVALLLLIASVGYAAGAMPQPPADAIDLGKSPIAQCGENWGVYQQGWDTDPASPTAAMFQFGRYELVTGEPRFFLPAVVIVVDDAGPKAFVLDRGKLEMYSIEALGEKYPDPCDLPGVRLDPVI